MAFFAVLAAPAAQADTGDVIEKQNQPPSAADGFQAGTCISDEPVKCSPDTPELFYKEAGGHPPIGFTQYIVKHKVIVPGVLEETEAVPRTIRVDLPPGLTVNPLATEQCTIAAFKADACPAGSKVGREEVTVSVRLENTVPSGPGTFFPKNAVLPPSTNPLLNTLVDVYNIVPEFGEPARFGFKIGSAKSEVYLEGDVAWESDYHAGFTIKLPPPNPAAHTLKSRLVNFGRSGDGSYITNPTTCLDPATRIYSTFLRADSVQMPDPDFPVGLTAWEAALPPGIQQEKCEEVPFDPTLAVAPGTNQIDSPAGPEVTVALPFLPNPLGKEQSHVRSAEVTLPRGMGLNPSGANGLVACSDAQFKKGQRVVSNECPAASKIGTAEVNTPPLPDGSLVGDVYVGEQQSSDPTSGDMFRILVEAKSERYGVVARLLGKVEADPKTGQLTTVFDDQLVSPFIGPLPKGLPQVPFETVKLRFDGSKAVLTSPPTCAKQTTTSLMEPWARPGTFASPSAEFALTTDPAGGPCPQTLAERKFTPKYTAKSKKKKAGAYSPFEVDISRSDGEQELKLVNVRLPKGLSAKLAGVPYCSEADLASAEKRSGKAELAESSCSAKSQMGTVTTVSGTGSNPLTIGGKAFLAGPYKGAPISMATITPAVAGPFDLGNVVVRVALHVNPKNARVNAISDVIPDVFGGAKLDIRSIDVKVNRKKFSLNPTSCRKQGTSGVLMGGGADPTNPAAFSSYKVKDPYQAKKCKKLGFKPKLFTRISGPVQRAKNSRIRAVLKARPGDANIKRTALTLPNSLFLDQSHIRTVCTRVQLAARECPKAAIYGRAAAKSPLLKRQLKGPVYLVSSDNLLPDLVADLRGQVNIQLHGVISSKGGGLKTVFAPLPDVPVRKFVLNMAGGEKSLLINSQNLCKSEQTAVLNMKGQNGKKIKDNRYRLNIASCGGGKK